MERQDIIDMLERKVAAQGGRKKRGGSSVDKFAKFDEALQNPYEDDGSLEFQALRIAVMKEMAKKVFGLADEAKPDMQQLAALRKSDIDKEMNRLKKLQDIKIKATREEMKKKIDAYEEALPDYKLKARYDAVQAFKPAAKVDDYEETLYANKNPYVSTVATKVAETAKTVKPKSYVVKDKPLLIAQGRPMSAYNKFVKSYFAKHPGATMKQAAAAWRK